MRAYIMPCVCCVVLCQKLSGNVRIPLSCTAAPTEEAAGVSCEVGNAAVAGAQLGDMRAAVQVMPFFNRVGFALPERKGIADFLQEVTSPKDQAQYW